MLSKEECENHLKLKENGYSKKEAEEIRKFLYQLGEIAFNEFLKTENEKERNNLC